MKEAGGRGSRQVQALTPSPFGRGLGRGLEVARVATALFPNGEKTKEEKVR